jgi:hypothetical protein
MVMFDAADGAKVLAFGSLLVTPPGEGGRGDAGGHLARCLAVSEGLGLEVIRERPTMSLADELGDAMVVWCAWTTGSAGALRGGIAKHDRIVRIVLTDPESDAFGRFQDGPALSERVRTVTDMALRAGISVSWLDADVGSGIIIVNPFGPSGWARVEFRGDGVEPARRPGVRVYSDKDPEIFAFLCRRFCDMAAQASMVSEGSARGGMPIGA